MVYSTKAERIIKYLLLIWFMVAIYFQHNTGLADNGDFTRSMKWIVSDPIGVTTDWQAVGNEEWFKRFYRYWIPYWKIKVDLSNLPRTSAILVWAPGVLLNYLFYSSEVLYLSSLSLLPKLILFFVLLLLFRWINLGGEYRIVLLFGLGFPLTFLFTSTDYIAYFNSFYQESTSFVFLFLLLASVLFLIHRPTHFSLFISLIVTLLLATSKPAYIYWASLTVPLLIYLRYSRQEMRYYRMVILVYAILLSAFFTLVSVLVTKAGSETVNPYHSLFHGALTFSDKPLEHLDTIGMNRNALKCIGKNAFTRIGSFCHSKYEAQLSYKNTLMVLFKEPLVVYRMLRYVLNNMQNVPSYLGKYSFDDPRITISSPSKKVVDKSSLISMGGQKLLNLWVKLKIRIFPKGQLLFFVLICFMFWFIMRMKCTGIHRDLAIIGLLSTIGCMIDMMVAIIGDGRHEIIKHLFLSNVLFDIGFIAFVNSVWIWLINLVKRERGNGVV